ncbi:FAD-binding oxidoreductase [Microbacterium sp. No. 7]|uniref:FAD-binding oxidoreductase n=1 Tax=Microbacterium sp. No. 7 TaxID=1714373 RepID=UPI0006D1C8D5|nr:FAD-binding protein [Microbacterium sp. No. 7]ALJ18754.1 hypothetical protein AOA12_02025 [Microbacterium sp. No. 7]
MDTSHEHLLALRSRLRGELVLPADDGWDDARRAWMLLADQHPAAVVVAADERDVVETVRAARSLGLHVAPQGTGHAAGALGALRDTILLRTTRLNAVSIDPVARVARVGAGAISADVAAAAAGHGLAAVSGMAPTVGVVGLVLGGGLGWLARSHGLASASVRAIEAVDAHARSIVIDETRHPELFWAARGGVAPVVVTAIELQLHPIAEIVAGGLLWPIERAAEVAHAWRAWACELPESVTSLVRVLRYPPLPELPEPLRGRAFVAVEAAFQEDAGAADALLRPLRALAPELDTMRPMSPAELPAVHGDPPQPVPAYGDTALLRELSTAAIDALLEAALAPSAAPLLSIEVRHLGGALAPGRTDAGAVSGIAGEGLLFALGIVPVPEALDAVRAAANGVLEAVAPFAGERTVKTFAERPASAASLYGPSLERVRQVVAAWDPEGVIRTAHPLD